MSKLSVVNSIGNMQAHQRHPTRLLSPEYETTTGDSRAGRIDVVLSEIPQSDRRFSRIGVHAFSTGKVVEASTCFEHVRRIFPIDRTPQFSKSFESLENSLVKSLEEILERPEEPVVALSGGIDSLLLASLLKELLGYPPKTATLVSNLPGYCEGEITMRLAESLGLGEVVAIKVTEEDFVGNLPQVIAACETPLYNLHPVSKWLFARGLRSMGYACCITGDGADQVAAGRFTYDYFPLLSPLFKAHGLDLLCPFTDTEVMKSIQAEGPDPQKKVIRRIAEDHLPKTFVEGSKRPCFAPPMNLSRYQNAKSFERLPERLGITVPKILNDRQRTFWTTLELLERSHLN